MARYYKVVLKLTDDEENLFGEDSIESAIEDTLEFLPYDLVGSVQEIEETDEDQ